MASAKQLIKIATEKCYAVSVANQVFISIVQMATTGLKLYLSGTSL